jgi:general stress protein YciG
MAGNRQGGLKAAQTNIQKFGKNFYRNIGSVGGKKSRGGGFAANPELARNAGRKGGLKSKRGPAKKEA